MSDSLANTRQEYEMSTLRLDDLDANPITQFENWYEQAAEHVVLDPNAAVLSTLHESGYPDARVILLKGVSDGSFVFFTNYASAKGEEISKDPKVSLVFYWKELQRQVRILGVASRISAEASDTYFHSRPRESQLGVWVSPQSRVIPDRATLEERMREYTEKFEGEEVPRPDYWGGYAIRPSQIEFWQGGRARLHDRFRYTMVEGSDWRIERLAP